MQKSVLVIFKNKLSVKDKHNLFTLKKITEIIAPIELKDEVLSYGLKWVDISTLIDPGSIYEASVFAEELSRLTLPDGRRVSKSFVYEGYELWWTHYDSLFYNFCLPYTEYKNLLFYLKGFDKIDIYFAPNKKLFSYFLQAHGCKNYIFADEKKSLFNLVPFGLIIQTFLTIIFLPTLIIRRKQLMVFSGDNFEKNKDYDFRMKFIYAEMRTRKLPFVEFVRSLESWKIICKHTIKRKRAVIYVSAISYIGQILSIITGGRYRAGRMFGQDAYFLVTDSEARFKLLIGTTYLQTVYDDIWAIRIMQMILNILGIKSSLILAAMGRNFHTVLACKMNTIPTIGILHGVSSLHYNVYDFLPGYDGEKSISVDKYGLWSDWWKEYYEKNSNAYTKDQLYVSGLMRPLNTTSAHMGPLCVSSPKIKVLFVSEQLASPEEVLPYLRALIEASEISVSIIFRPFCDGFEVWLKKHHPEILNMIGEDNVLRDGIHEAISRSDVVVGTQSTGVLEALLQHKPILFFATKRWGDYFNLKEFDKNFIFYAENKIIFLDCIRNRKEIPDSVLTSLLFRFFGDPSKNGSKWAVDELIAASNRK